MRSRIRDRQNVYFVTVTERLDGIDTVEIYSKPRKERLTVSYTASTPEELAAGIVPDYDRYITCYNKSLKVVEGDKCFVDVVPEVDADGYLILEADGVTPVTMPDYIVKRIIHTQRGIVVRYGIKKLGVEGE